MPGERPLLSVRVQRMERFAVVFPKPLAGRGSVQSPLHFRNRFVSP